MQVDESTDTHDTIVWLLKHIDGHKGKVGLRGISYPGFYAVAGAIILTMDACQHSAALSDRW